MRRSERLIYRIPIEPTLGKVKSGLPWVLWYVKSLKASSPFLDLKKVNLIDAKILDLLSEGQEIEIEFETLGRHIKLLGSYKWLKYESLWKNALLCALEAREKERKSP